MNMLQSVPRKTQPHRPSPAPDSDGSLGQFRTGIQSLSLDQISDFQGSLNEVWHFAELLQDTDLMAVIDDREELAWNEIRRRPQHIACVDMTSKRMRDRRFD